MRLETRVRQIRTEIRGIAIETREDIIRIKDLSRLLQTPITTCLAIAQVGGEHCLGIRVDFTGAMNVRL